MEIKHLAKSDRVCNFFEVDCGQVRVSHHLANWARTERRTLFTFGFGPDVLQDVVELERLISQKHPRTHIKRQVLVPLNLIKEVVLSVCLESLRWIFDCD